MSVDFTHVSESPGDFVSQEALSMLYTRYRFAADFCENKTVLEVACGPGFGLGYLTEASASVVGGDFTENLIRVAREHNDRRVPLLLLDAQALPFRESSFDLLLLYEAIYYLARPERFLEECRRLLREGGRLIVCTANRELVDFNPSPFSTRYLAASELCNLLRRHGFDTDAYGAFPTETRSVKTSIVSWIKRTAVALNLVPKTMKGKALFKRMFLGSLYRMPGQIGDDTAPYCQPMPIVPSRPCMEYKVIFVVARLGATARQSV